jgi:hypothetical protein
VEWFEYLPAAEKDEFLEVNLAHSGARRRRLTFSAYGARYEKIIEEFKSSRVQGFKGSKESRRPKP